MELTDKQQRFVDEYVVDFNAAAAARRAGYSERTCRVIGPENLSKPAVAAAITVRLDELAAKTRLTAERAWIESRCIATSNIAEIFDFTGKQITMRDASDIPESARRAIKSMKIKVKRYTEGNGDDSREVELTEIEVTLWDKPGQLNTLLKALGELKEKHQYGSPDGVPIPICTISTIRSKPHEPRADQPVAVDGGGGGDRSNAEAKRASA